MEVAQKLRTDLLLAQWVELFREGEANYTHLRKAASRICVHFYRMLHRIEYLSLLGDTAETPEVQFNDGKERNRLIGQEL